MHSPLVRLESVTLRRDGQSILKDINWMISPGERWVVLGLNGSGKTNLCRIIALDERPSSGTIGLFGEELGRMDIRSQRERIGFSSAAVAERLLPQFLVLDIVLTGMHGALAPWWHTYTETDRVKARELLSMVDLGTFADRPFGTLSSGERQRVLLARTLAADPEILILDEPNAGLDLRGREQLMRSLTTIAARGTVDALVLTTHHVEEIPLGFTHVLMLAAGRQFVAGPLEVALTAEALSECFEMRVKLDRRAGRWLAWAE